MGSGCDVAKDSSDLIIMDNDFRSIHRAIKWGRALYDNVRKFIQFQLTINVVLCFITILGGATVGHPPLNVVQMLWCNLIMDVLGAIALGTEPYRKDHTGPRISRKDFIMNPELWRQIVLHSIYQILVMVVLMYFGNSMFATQPFNLITEPKDSPDRKTVDTICFHTFILMSLFNSINARVVDANEMNVFKTLFNNTIYWFVLSAEFGIQYLMLWLGGGGPDALGSKITGTTELTVSQHIVCLCLGVSVLLINPLVKMVPRDKFVWISMNVNLEEDDDQEGVNRIMKKLTTITQAAEETFRKEEENE